MAYGRVALGADLTGDVQYYVDQSNAIAGNAYIGAPIYSNVDGLNYVGYPRGVVPWQAQQLLDAGYETATGDFNNALIALLKTTSRPATIADISTASSFTPAPPPAPVVGPTQYLVNGTLYTNLADAQAAADAAPPPPPPADTGTIHYDQATDSYLPGPTPAGASSSASGTSSSGTSTALTPANAPIAIDPQGANVEPLLSAVATSDGLSGRTLAIGAAVGLGLLLLSRKRA